MQRSNHHSHSLSRSIGGWFGAGLIGSTLLMVSPAAAADALSAWQFDPNTSQFTITLPQGIAPRVLVAAEPARIILEIPQTRLGQVDTEANYDGTVRSIRLLETEGNILQVVLELAPGTVLSPDQAQLTSVSAADQTRWVLTPLVAEAGSLATETEPGNRSTGAREAHGETLEAGVAVPSLPLDSIDADVSLTPPPGVAAGPGQPEPAATPSPPEMVVELPVIPAAEPGLGFPEAGQGRLSTTAANLMLPSDIDGLANLPDTLPIDPFSMGMAETEQVTVPGLEELDAATGPIATMPSLPVTGVDGPTTDESAAAGFDPTAGEAIEVMPAEENDAPPVADPEGIAAVAPSEIAPASENTRPLTAAPPSTAQPAESLPETPAAADAVPEPAAIAESDASQTVAASPTLEPTTTAITPDVQASDPISSAPPSPASPDPMAEEATEEDAVELEVVPPVPENVAVPEANLTAPSQVEDGVIDVEPGSTPQGQPTAVMSQAPPAAGAAVVDRPAAAEMPPSQDLLVVPELPRTEASGPVIPPSNIPASEVVVAASEPINFGQPLPGSADIAILNPSEPRAMPPANHDIPPDILIAAGTVLELRYPGNEPLVLEPGTDLNEVMLLESAIVDPITQGVLAPRGSQLIGRFEPSGTNQQWVSEMIIVSNGQRVPLASTSETLIGTPQVNGGRLAAGSGAGALALALLTGFSGIGLIGGAIVGATTMVGTSPQQVVIEPNQIIAVQVTENVPRAMPIAVGPDLSREWGVE